MHYSAPRRRADAAPGHPLPYERASHLTGCPGRAARQRSFLKEPCRPLGAFNLSLSVEGDTKERDLYS